MEPVKSENFLPSKEKEKASILTSLSLRFYRCRTLIANVFSIAVEWFLFAAFNRPTITTLLTLFERVFIVSCHIIIYLPFRIVRQSMFVFTCTSRIGEFGFCALLKEDQPVYEVS